MISPTAITLQATAVNIQNVIWQFYQQKKISVFIHWEHSARSILSMDTQYEVRQ